MWCNTQCKLICSRGRILMLILPLFVLPYLMLNGTVSIRDTSERNPVDKISTDTDASKSQTSIISSAMKLHKNISNSPQETDVRKELQLTTKSGDVVNGDEVDDIKASQIKSKNNEMEIETALEGHERSYEKMNSIKRNNETQTAKVDRTPDIHTPRNQESLVPQSVRAKEKVTENGPHVLLLSSVGRSGSSFLGGLLTAQSNVFYFFEPLKFLLEHGKLIQETAVQRIQALIACNITDLIPEAVLDRSFPVMRKCYGNCNKEKQAQQQCRQHPIRVVKTIRNYVAWLPPLLTDPTINLKVIHLVRDPRASLISMWDNWDINITALDTCMKIDQDMAAGRTLRKLYSDRFLAVRYEDLCEAPMDAAHTIFSYLGYTDLPDSVERFVKDFTSGRDQGPTYNIKRNTKKMQQKWRSKITEKQLRIIERECEQAIHNLGFSLFRTVSAARNLTLPLYNDTIRNTYFTIPGE